MPIWVQLFGGVVAILLAVAAGFSKSWTKIVTTEVKVDALGKDLLAVSKKVDDHRFEVTTRLDRFDDKLDRFVQVASENQTKVIAAVSGIHAHDVPK